VQTHVQDSRCGGCTSAPQSGRSTAELIELNQIAYLESHIREARLSRLLLRDLYSDGGTIHTYVLAAKFMRGKSRSKSPVPLPSSSTQRGRGCPDTIKPREPPVFTAGVTKAPVDQTPMYRCQGFAQALPDHC